MKLNLNRRRVLTLIGLIVAAAIGAAGVAYAITTATLADATTVNDGTFRSDNGKIRLKTRGAVRIRDVQTTDAAPGFTSGWHTHPGPVIVAMTSTSAGSLTIYQPAGRNGEDDEEFGGPATCTKTVISAGQAYIEIPNVPVLARNEGAGNASWVTTMIVPIGVPFTNPLTTGPCNV